MLYAGVGMPPSVEERSIEGIIRAGEDRRLGYRLSYPYVRGYGGISSYYSSAAAVYAKYIQRRYKGPLYSLPSGEYEIYGGFEVTYSGGRLLSIYQDTYENMGPYKVALGRSAAVWDLFRGRKLSLDELFSDPYALNVRVSKIIDRAVDEGRRDSPGSYFYVFSPSRWGWYLTERGLAVFFQPETIAPQNGGLPLFFVPWDDIRDLARFEL